MLGLLAEDGLAITPDAEQADAIVINTCGFLEASKDESLREIRDAIELKGRGKVKRVVVCGGKVYYDLLEEAQKQKLDNVAIVRVEQLYPFPRIELAAELKRFAGATDVVWCQEEPQNQGAWYQIRHHLAACLAPKQSLSYAGRARSPSPAAGHFSDHVIEQTALVADALVNPLRGESCAE